MAERTARPEVVRDLVSPLLRYRPFLEAIRATEGGGSQSVSMLSLAAPSG